MKNTDLFPKCKLCHKVKEHRNYPPSGFGFLTPLGLNCDAKEHNLIIWANLSE